MRDLPRRGVEKKDTIVKIWLSEDQNKRCVLKGKGKEPAKTEEEEEDGQRRAWNRMFILRGGTASAKVLISGPRIPKLSSQCDNSLRVCE